MKVAIVAMGRQKGGPEGLMVDNYLSRASRTGRQLGLGPFDLREQDDRRGGGKASEAALLRKSAAGSAILVALDERGQTLTSPKFATKLETWRDAGQGDLAFLIGGADGLDPALVAETSFVLSFGAMVWPHMLARVMLAEQLYRATAILAGTPYHRV